jgi:perosamine synthetase
MGAILELASRFGLRVVEDAAHALPASWGGRRVGSISDASCFSFYATKTLTTGEGGMVTTENGGWAGMLRRLRLHGIGEDAWARQKAAESWRYEVLGPGFKCNMNDIAAALGLAQLSRCDELHRSRENIARLYGEALGDVEEIALPSAGPQDRHAWHLYIIQLRLDRLSLSRDRFIAELGARGIGASVHFIPLHLHPRYRGDGGRPWEDLPSSTSAGERILSLPIYPAMTEADARRVAGAVLDIVRRFRR